MSAQPHVKATGQHLAQNQLPVPWAGLLAWGLGAGLQGGLPLGLPPGTRWVGCSVRRRQGVTRAARARLLRLGGSRLLHPASLMPTLPDQAQARQAHQAPDVAGGWLR